MSRPATTDDVARLMCDLVTGMLNRTISHEDVRDAASGMRVAIEATKLRCKYGPDNGREPVRLY